MYLSPIILHTAAIISLAGLRRHQDCLSGIPRMPSATQMAAATPSPWKTAATEHRDEPRTAQTFVCCGPGNVTADVINVHAPSGKKSLTDKQRIALLTNLLQSNSQSMPGQEIGRARFLIGGDMNTSSSTASEIASVIAVSATATEHGCLGLD
jgi:hypothetical protein